MMYSVQAKETASSIYHDYLEETHHAIQDFNTGAHYESMNKMNILWSQLHIAGGAKYVYGAPDHDEFSYHWLWTKGKHVIDELLQDAEKAQMKNAVKTLKELRKILEEKKLIN